MLWALKLSVSIYLYLVLLHILGIVDLYTRLLYLMPNLINILVKLPNITNFSIVEVFQIFGVFPLFWYSRKSSFAWIRYFSEVWFTSVEKIKELDSYYSGEK